MISSSPASCIWSFLKFSHTFPTVHSMASILKDLKHLFLKYATVSNERHDGLLYQSLTFSTISTAVYYDDALALRSTAFLIPSPQWHHFWCMDRGWSEISYYLSIISGYQKWSRWIDDDARSYTPRGTYRHRNSCTVIRLVPNLWRKTTNMKFWLRFHIIPWEGLIQQISTSSSRYLTYKTKINREGWNCLSTSR